MDNVNSVLQPDFHNGYCDYFYYLMVIYLIIGTLSVADFFLSGIKNITNFSTFMKNHMGSKVIQLLTLFAHFFVIRLLYSMCARSLPAREGFREGTKSKDEEFRGRRSEGFYGGSDVNEDI